ncbi:Transcriptional regulator, LysR family (fragment) [Paraburkholderia piptadeniae]|uniref:Transcriptional regulator, LysR family n=1 Tax=Paraburkholderia piptadeniae TaxID=1701573 RepID=A0A1N7SU20_9BURK
MHVSGPVQTNTAESLALAIRDGIGVGILPVYSALDALRDGTLVRVLPDHVLQKMNVYALHPSRKFTDAKVRTWVELLRAQVPEMIARDVEALNAIAREPNAA